MAPWLKAWTAFAFMKDKEGNYRNLGTNRSFAFLFPTIDQHTTTSHWFLKFRNAYLANRNRSRDTHDRGSNQVCRRNSKIDVSSHNRTGNSGKTGGHTQIWIYRLAVQKSCNWLTKFGPGHDWRQDQWDIWLWIKITHDQHKAWQDKQTLLQRLVRDTFPICPSRLTLSNPRRGSGDDGLGTRYVHELEEEPSTERAKPIILMDQNLDSQVLYNPLHYTHVIHHLDKGNEENDGP